MKLERILLTTDFSDCARHAYPVAADIARRSGAHLYLVRCVDYPLQYLPAGTAPERGGMDEYREILRSRLGEEAGSNVFRGLSVEPVLLDGYSPDTARKFAEERGADLMVQASHGYRGWKRFLLGSFAVRMLRLSSIPLLTVKAGGDEDVPETGFPPRCILFPHDFSSASRQALGALRLFSRLYSSRIIVLSVWQTVRVPAIHFLGGEAPSWELEQDAGQDFPGSLLDDLKRFTRRELDGLECTEAVASGDPATMILDRAAAYRADLICMATHGWSGPTRLLIGSVAEKVVREAPCSVLTVRARPGAA